MSRLRAPTVLRVLQGSLLLLAPDQVLRALRHPPPDRPALTVLRVLGARQLLQAALVGPRASSGRLRAGAAVDGLHSATMIALAAARPAWRIPGGLDAVTAASFAVAGIAASRRAR